MGMNKEISVCQGNFFSLKKNKPLEIQESIKRVNQLSKGAIYDLTWDNFYRELRQLGTRDFMRHYGFSTRRKLQAFISKSNLWQERITLNSFEADTQSELIGHLGDKFFTQVLLQGDFDPKKHKLSTIHYFVHNFSLNFAVLRLGFSNLQSFLNFFVKTTFVPECSENKAKDLTIAVNVLQKTDLTEMRDKLAHLYDEPLIKRNDFKRYDYTLQELKLALETESFSMVMASLGGCNTSFFNKKLKSLKPAINIQLADLKEKPWEELLQNIPIQFWKVKLHILFSPGVFYEWRRFPKETFACSSRFFDLQQNVIEAPVQCNSGLESTHLHLGSHI